MSPKLPPALVRKPWRSRKGRRVPVVEELAVLQVEGELAPVVFSELLRDLARLAG